MTTPTPNPRHRFGFRLVLLARRWRQAIDAELLAAGLTDAAWRPLIHLHRQGGGMRQKDLAAALGVDGSTVVRLIGLLEERGLLERHDDPADGRAKCLYLTDAGLRLVDTMQTMITAAEETLLSDFSDDELLMMMDAFDRLDSSLSQRRGA
ncbi:MarR family transcriptional regulator for hemolysin [Azospirillum fermentarium]|uniref:MarR family winged helix-turn-helix transcriptional regulator n=1 Tax=Azospirillum fermentarium TaxID=1233114 RepID=UPI002226102A|nr:MarR family transcriptional regulator [Azospirillum fermentarium]MCW2248406.1 MarR family transcriptional regulator for hemolysin [Azospirillum fermentarium]